MIAKELVQKCAEALISTYNYQQGQKNGAVRLVAFRQLYSDLKQLGCAYLIATAIKPNDYPTEKWFI